MSRVYAIDACSLINASKSYSLSKKSFAFIWDKMNELIGDGVLISSIEILSELKDEDLQEWAKINKKCFLPLTKEIQEETIDILREFPDMIKITTKGNSNADPFLIATAMVNNAVIVTDERKVGPNSSEVHIPNVCIEKNIEYINLNQFLDIFFE